MLEQRETINIMSGGKKLFATLHRPVTKSKVPAVLICHGFAGTKVGRFRLYVRLSEALSKLGIASLRVDFMGCGDSEGDFLDTTMNSMINDAMVSLQYLASHPDVDATRIGLLGRSMGGPVAVGIARRFGHIKSLALWCPVYDGKQWAGEWATAMQQEIKEINGHSSVLFYGQETNPELFKQFFQFHTDEELRALQHIPLLHVHSEEDHVVSMAHASEYERQRKGLKAETRLIRLKKSDHEFSDHNEQRQTVQETAQWFHNTL